MAVIMAWSGILIHKKHGQDSAAVELPPSAMPRTSQPRISQPKTSQPGYRRMEAPLVNPASVQPLLTHVDSPSPPPYEANVKDELPSYHTVVSNS